MATNGVLRILQSSSITGTSSDCLMSYTGHSLRESYLSVELQSVSSRAAADWTQSSLSTKYSITHKYLKLKHFPIRSELSCISKIIEFYISSCTLYNQDVWSYKSNSTIPLFVNRIWYKWYIMGPILFMYRFRFLCLMAYQPSWVI